MLRSLRGRVIAGLVVLLALACATVGVTAYFVTRSSVSNSLDAQLQSDTSVWTACADSPPFGHDHTTRRITGPGSGSAADARVCPGLGDKTFGARLAHGVFTLHGVVQDTTSGAKTVEVNLTAADQATLKALPAEPLPPTGESPPTYTRDLPSLGGDYRLTAVRGQDGAILITGLPMALMNRTLSNVAITSLIVSAVVLLLAGVLGTLLVRLSLRPLERVASTATQVADLPLESGEVELPAGVPDTDPDTEAGRVGSAFNRMLGHIQATLARRAASEARLRRFAADASHELRTPLSSIRGYAELALRHPGPVPDDVTHALRRVEAESARMSVLVDDLLLLARLDAGRPLASEPVDLSRLVIDAISDAQVARSDHRWTLELPDDPVQAPGDVMRLHQVVANLLSNAGRHTPAGTTISLRLTVNPDPPADAATAADGAAYVRRGEVPPSPLVEVSVTDDGPGVPPELLPELFERFTRADTARTHSDGASTGLGLAIVDAVIAAHKGCITVTSRPGMTRFTITLTGMPGADVSPAKQRAGRRTLHRGS
jgi:two-component system, OmpR family, sensor kinase